MNTVSTSVRLPEDLVARYTQLAEATGRTRNFVMKEALEQYIEQEEVPRQSEAQAPDHRR
jgi:predicted transcriptional regulator